MAIGEAPVLEALTDINAVSIARSEFDPATLILVRAAALVAVDAPPMSYLMHIGAALESGVTVKDIQDVLVAVAPITGAPRVLTAARNITQALGVAIALLEDMEDAEADAQASSGNGSRADSAS
jgi:alkylhydroperoxidase/carboxymuconolactone decarboxylase family protein YurZ